MRRLDVSINLTTKPGIACLTAMVCILAPAILALCGCGSAGPEATGIEPSAEFTVFDIVPETDGQRMLQAEQLVSQARNSIEACEEKFRKVTSDESFRRFLTSGANSNASKALVVLQIEDVAYTCETSAKVLRSNFQKISGEMPAGARKTMSYAIYHSVQALQGRSTVVKTMVDLFDDAKPSDARKTIEARDQVITNQEKALRLLEEVTPKACEGLDLNPCPNQNPPSTN